MDEKTIGTGPSKSETSSVNEATGATSARAADGHASPSGSLPVAGPGLVGAPAVGAAPGSAQPEPPRFEKLSVVDASGKGHTVIADGKVVDGSLAFPGHPADANVPKAVRLKFTDNVAPYVSNDVATIPFDTAARYVRAGVAVGDGDEALAYLEQQGVVHPSDRDDAIDLKANPRAVIAGATELPKEAHVGNEALAPQERKRVIGARVDGDHAVEKYAGDGAPVEGEVLTVAPEADPKRETNPVTEDENTAKEKGLLSEEFREGDVKPAVYTGGDGTDGSDGKRVDFGTSNAASNQSSEASADSVRRANGDESDASSNGSSKSSKNKKR